MAAFADKPGSRARATPHRIRKGQIRKKLHKIASQDATLRTSNRRLPSENRQEAGVSREAVSDATHQQPEVAKRKPAGGRCFA
jgi:hypothetical protein